MSQQKSLKSISYVPHVNAADGDDVGGFAHGRIPALDGIRGIAILIVVWGHYFAYRMGDPSHSWGMRTIRFFQEAWVGVDLFFVLSGFLITGILLDAKGAFNIVRVFYTRRAARILPPYLLIVAVSFVAAGCLEGQGRYNWLFGGLMPLWSYLTLTQNIIMGWLHDYGARSLAATWSLGIEEQFYLMWPWVVLACRSNRQLLYLSGLLVVLAPVLRFVAPGPEWAFTPFMRMDSLIFGAVVAIALRDNAILGCLNANRAKIGLIAGVLILIGVEQCYRDVADSIKHTTLGVAFGMTILYLLIAPESLAAKAVSVGWLRWVGRISYGLYLYHEFVRGMVFGCFLNHPPALANFQDLLATVGSLVASLILAGVSARFYEKHFLDLGKKFKYSKIQE